MTLRAVLLALLSKEPNTGYGLGRLLRDDLHYLWDARLQQIYAELARLRAGGLLEVETIALPNRPPKKVYSLTPEGEEGLDDWLLVPPAPHANKDETVTISFARPWKRLTYRDAVAERLGASVQEITDPAYVLAQARKHRCELKGGESYWKLVTLLFEQVVEPTLVQPTFITDFPVETSPLAKRKASDPELTDRFELYIAGREIANAFSELNDPLDQRRRFEAQMAERAKGDLEAQHLDEDFLRALEHGMPPTAGEGIGIDRLVMLLTNQTSIRDVILFPQLRPEK